jgi:hypothetical protein
MPANAEDWPRAVHADGRGNSASFHSGVCRKPGRAARRG